MKSSQGSSVLTAWKWDIRFKISVLEDISASSENDTYKPIMYQSSGNFFNTMKTIKIIYYQKIMEFYVCFAFSGGK